MATRDDLYRFLAQRKKMSDAEVANYVSFSGREDKKYNGSYYVSETDKPVLYHMYAEIVARQQEELYLLEKPGPCAPVLVDIDLRLPNGQRTYTPEMVQNLVRAYYDFFREYVEIPDTARVYVMERSAPYNSSKDSSKEQWKDGLHLLMTLNVVTDLRQLARIYVIEKCGAQLKTMSPLSRSAEEIIDAAVISRNHWYVYGSGKPGIEPYKITSVIRPDMSEDVSWKDKPLVDLIKELSVTGTQDQTVPWLPGMEEKAVQRKSETFGVPLNQRRTAASSTNATANNAPSMVRPLPTAHANRADADPEKFSFIRAMVMQCLSPERYERYDMWRDLGYVLHWISRAYTDPNTEMLGLWIQFSERSPKFKPGECECMWARMENGRGLTLGSLLFWARMDNPEEYERIMSEDLRSAIEKSVREGNGSETMIARVLHRMFRTQYVTTKPIGGGRTTKWYEYVPHLHHWVEIPEGNSLRNKISEELRNEYTKVSRFYHAQAMSTNDSVERDNKNNAATKFQAVADKLCKTSFKENVMKEVGHMFYDANFETRINQDNQLVGFLNGVLDLRTMEFRDGRPEDYITMSASVQYVEYNEDSEEVQHLLRIISQIITDDPTRLFVLKLLASCFLGGNKEQKFYIWQGVGCHARGARLMMADGSIREVQDIQLGDQLMGDDGTARTVLDLKRGRDQMARIVPNKGDPWVVNQHHLLTLVAGPLVRQQRDGKLIWLDRASKRICYADADTSDYPETAVTAGEVLDITVQSYQTDVVPMLGPHALFLFRTPTAFPAQPVPLPPYAVGLWAAQGKTERRAPNRVRVDSVDAAGRLERELGPAGYALSREPNVRNTFRIRPMNPDTPAWEDAVKAAGMDAVSRTVSLAYTANHADVQRQLLAGMIDSRGKFEVDNKHIAIAMPTLEGMRSAAFVARSLGYGCRTYVAKFPKHEPRPGFMVFINGGNMEAIPTTKPEARIPIKHEPREGRDPLRTGFRIERLPEDDFFGFELDGNGRYLMEDHLVTHNSNGKSMLVNFMKNSFGQYATQANVTLLTRTRASSGSANPDLVDLAGRRFVVLQEPEENEKLNTGFMKELTGGDTISVRGLYQGQTQLKPQFKFIYCCNHLPNIVTSDFGTWRRIVVIPFLSQFLDPSRLDPENPRHFPIDPGLADVMERQEYKEAFMCILVRYYRLYLETGLRPPELVLRATQQYQEKSDIISEFLAERTERTENLKDVLHIRALYSDFKFWYKENYGASSDRNVKTPNRNELKERVEKIIGPCGNGWKGYKIKPPQDREGEGDGEPENDDDE